MGIKMRQNKDDNVRCKICNCNKDNCLALFDIAFTDKHIITVCDECNNKLLSKVLKASCMIDSKVKTQKEMGIIKARDIRKHSE